MIKNYYQILGLTKDCSKEDIKKAYRIYATKFHPDKQNNDKFFEEKFKEIKEAYDILIDDNKRANFDFNYSSSSKKNYSNYSNTSEKSSTESQMDEMARKLKEMKKAEEIKRKKIYYTSKDLILNGLYLFHNKISYKLSDYDKSTIRKNDETQFGCFGVILIIIGILTITFFVGILFLFVGIALLFYREYFIILINKKGETLLLKGTKSKMKKISNIINKAIIENNK
jgi:curved DNA-binding protein CbpA